MSLLQAKLRDFSAHFALKCASFCVTNVGTSKRTACSSTGFTEYESVRCSNKLAIRMVIQNMLIRVQGVRVVFPTPN